jgi:hypothetical protein
MSRLLGVKRGVYIILVTDESRQRQLRERAQQMGVKVKFVDRIADPMIAQAIQLGGLVHDDLGYRFMRRGKTWYRVRGSSSTPCEQPEAGT